MSYFNKWLQGYWSGYEDGFSVGWQLGIRPDSSEIKEVRFPTPYPGVRWVLRDENGPLAIPRLTRDDSLREVILRDEIEQRAKMGPLP